MPAQWVCASCEYENEADIDPCDGCGEAKPEAAAAAASDDAYANIVVGVVQSVEPVANKDKLFTLTVDIGDGEILPIVTNATNVAEGSHVVVAKIGAVVGDITVKKATVGGAQSSGMLCDAPMLGWVGGGAGAAALVPASFSAGSRPPQSRPRMN